MRAHAESPVHNARAKNSYCDLGDRYSRTLFVRSSIFLNNFGRKEERFFIEHDVELFGVTGR